MTLTTPFKVVCHPNRTSLSPHITWWLWVRLPAAHCW